MKFRHFSAAAALFAGVAFSNTAGAQITADSDPVLFWNELATRVVPGAPPAQARILAIMNTAIYDAVNKASNGAGTYYVNGVAAPGGNAQAAASVAAHDVLVSLNAANAAAYDAALASSLSRVPDGVGKTNGMATGAAYASAMLALRANDGSAAVVPYTPGTNPGEWRPTPPGYAPAVAPQWGGVTPFLMTSGSQFRPGPPPSLDSAEYLAAYNEVKDIGAFDSTTRTADQTASAQFWNLANGATWIRIGNDMIADDNQSTFANAQVMARLSVAVADALIAGFDTKYTYNFWRPVTAIQEGDNDGIAGTIGDADWNPLLVTPAHPSYLSTHSIVSGAATTVLLGLGQDQSFCATISGDTRCFDGLVQAGQDAANSRLWGGIHYRFDNETGLATGQEIGRWTLAQNPFAAVPEPATWATMILGFGFIGGALRGRPARVRFGEDRTAPAPAV